MSTLNEERATVKAFGALEIKDADKGEVEAIIATTETVDRDHEVILKGAIPDGAKVKLSGYGHGAMFGEMPVGKGTLHNDGSKVIFRGKFFISTPRGREAFDTLKEFGSDQEWSFGFRVLDAENASEEWLKQGAFRVLKKLEPFEVSPVLLGAGIGTRTIKIKCDGCGSDHEGETCEPCQVKVEEETKAKAAAAAKVAAEIQHAKAKAAVEDYQRIQRTLKRLGVA